MFLLISIKQSFSIREPPPENTLSTWSILFRPVPRQQRKQTKEKTSGNPNFKCFKNSCFFFLLSEALSKQKCCSILKKALYKHNEISKGLLLLTNDALLVWDSGRQYFRKYINQATVNHITWSCLPNSIPHRNGTTLALIKYKFFAESDFRGWHNCWNVPTRLALAQRQSLGGPGWLSLEGSWRSQQIHRGHILCCV